MSVSKCPADAITSFPLYLTAGYTPTADEYTAIQQDVGINIQFGPRIIPPTIVTNDSVAGKCIIDEGSFVNTVLSGGSYIQAEINALKGQSSPTAEVTRERQNLERAGSVLGEIDDIKDSMKADSASSGPFGSEHYRERQYNRQNSIKGLETEYGSIPEPGGGDGPPPGPNLSPTTSTLVLNNNNYTLYSVQIVKATHNQWLPSNKAANTEDIIIVFQNVNNRGKIAYVICVVPIIRDTSTQNPYLYALQTGNLLAGTTSISIKDVMPQTGQYIYYITCLDGYSELSRSQDVCTFVSVAGLAVKSDIITGILSKISTPSPTTFPNVLLPYTARLAQYIKTMIAKEDLSTFVVSTNNLFTTPATQSVTSRSQAVERISTEAVKCSVINPDTDIDGNGMILADINTGDILKNVMEERNGVINIATNDKAKNREQSKNIQNGITWAFTIILILLLLASIIYFIIIRYIPVAEAGAGAGVQIPPWYSAIPSSVLWVSACIICFSIGLGIAAR
jgi:hypothetical protein